MIENGLHQNILYSCVEEKIRGHEQFVEGHTFGIIISGESDFYTLEGIKKYKERSIGLIKRNQLAKTTKIPAPGGIFKAINIVFTQDFLHRYAAENNIPPSLPYQSKGMMELKEDVFLKGYFDSLLPYFDEPHRMTDALADIKTREALELLLKTDKRCKELLFDFSEPFKIDLEAYMNKHFIYNVPLAQFAKLTGRSLATFKRDFQKTFQASPEKWLHQKRLEHAHYLISQKKQPLLDICLDVGFENISHFSTSFKKFYGYTPSSIR